MQIWGKAMRNMSLHSHKHSKKGTTLVELVVAMTLTAIFAVACIALIHPIESIYQRTEKTVRAQLLADTVVDSIRKECDDVQYDEEYSVWIASGTFDVSSEDDNKLFTKGVDLNTGDPGQILVIKRNNNYCEAIYSCLNISDENVQAVKDNAKTGTTTGHAVSRFETDPENRKAGIVHYGYYQAKDSGKGLYPFAAYDYTNPVTASTYGDYSVMLEFSNLTYRNDNTKNAKYPAFVECTVDVYDGDIRESGVISKGPIYSRKTAICFSANGSAQGAGSDIGGQPVNKKKDIKVVVDWVDDSNANNTRPTSAIKYVLYDNYDHILGTYELSDFTKDQNTFAFANIDTSNGVKIAVEPDPVNDNYLSADISSTSYGFSITHVVNDTPDIRLIKGTDFRDLINKKGAISSVIFEAETDANLSHVSSSSFIDYVSIDINGNKTEDYKLYIVTKNGKRTAYIHSKTGTFIANEDCSNMFANCESLTSITWTDSNNHFVIDTSETTNMNSMFLNCKSMKQFNVPNLVQASCLDTANMFSGCTGAEECNSLTTWNTSGVTDMSLMFYNFGSSLSNDKSLQINISGFDFQSCRSLNQMFSGCGASEINFPEMTDAKTNNINNIDYLFYNCKKLSTITNFLVNKESSSDSALSSAPHVYFNGVESLKNLFDGCPKLKNIRLWISLSNCTSVEYMISNCVNLNTADLSGSDFSSVTRMVRLFNKCEELTTLKINEHASFSSFTGEFALVNNSQILPSFEGCNKLTHLEMKDADLSSVTDAIFIVRKSLTYLDLSGAIMTSYTNIPGLCKDKTNKDYNLEYIDLTGTQFGNYDSAYQMFSRCKKIQTVEGFKLPINSSEMFNGCDKTTSITLLNCDASEVMNMNNMFKGCTALTTIDMSGFNAPNLTIMSSMFNGCTALTTVDLSGSNVPNVTNMSSLFKGCTALTTVNMSGFKAPNLKNCQSLFEGCSNLIVNTDIFTKWNATGITNLSYIFKDCTKMGTSSNGLIKLSDLNLSSCETMAGAFDGCTALTTLEFNNVNLESCSNYTGLISNCPALTNVNILSSNLTAAQDLSFLKPAKNINLSGSTFGMSSLANAFKSSNIERITLNSTQFPNCTNISSMFYGCINLTSVSMSGFNAPKLENCQSLFEGCSNLDVNADIFTKWNATGITNLSYIFKNCTKMGTSSNGLIKLSDLNLSSCETMAGAFDGCTALTTLEFNNVNLESCSNYTGLISNCPALTNVNILSSNLTAAQDLSFLKPAKNINLSGSTFGMSSLANAFKSSNIETINLSGTKFPNCTTFVSMFQDCKKLNRVTMVGLDTPSLTICDCMFQNCYSLNIPEGGTAGWKSSSVTSVYRMFYNACYNYNFEYDGLPDAVIDISGLKFTNIESFKEMFFNEKKINNVAYDSSKDVLKKIILPSGDDAIDNAATVTTYRMFNNRKHLTDLVNIEYFCITNEHTDARSTFANIGVTELDISSLNFDNISNTADYMFNENTYLTKIYVNPNCDYASFAQKNKDKQLFKDDKILAGPYTNWSTEKGSMARIDTQNTPGYFSVK